jgi:UDP-N-acetylmuramoyl-tripeptide--D-alanyl-D-alanine ligase
MKIEELYAVYLSHPSIQTDTRKLKAGDLYFALKGPNFNGNAFAATALEAGAAFAVIDEVAYSVEGKTILVDDVLQTLQALAKHHRQQFSIPFLAITGSNGKTTTKELIHAVLTTRFKTYTTEGNLNNHIGVPLTILKVGLDAQLAVIEMGANHIGEIASYCAIALPTHGLITNCGKAHLEGFGSEEGVRKGKGELFDHLRENGGTAFVMWDFPYLRDMSSGISKIFKYGSVEGDVVGTATASDPFLEVLFTKGFDGTVKTALVGGYNLPNVLAAVTVGSHFEVEGEEIKRALAAYQPSNSRSQLIRKGSNTIILDAYNANPSSMKLAIENFANSKGDNKILLLGSMAELGAGSVQEHKAIVNEISKHQWKDVVLVGGDFMKFDHTFRSMNSVTEAGSWLQSKNPQNSSLLIKGSRSASMEKILDYL